ncbi:GATA zinc finger domain-containing protein 10 isoform X1 [Culex quinquefasciatus]|uniref:GATA zinc finger domain-containing protein 10 isoform X1 n=1 Tax=Culex quinquefasciatus TaxID=7176 RepID=UPI0018E38FC9|nr:GATA zinc finger domain-containing protein 10 isoform X1 [Culex quinquefasciatus]XP_039440503.1 GATA zinc finger domain-containing protein 10 isoform X1 [Culex pipiens pallens]
MARLTEEMVIARSKQSDLGAIKKLNCWGSELSDVSIIRRMRGVEVLAFSVNRISTLADFENCINLQELYLRKNNLTDIDELMYLQNLPKLKNLWLEENPLVDSAGPNYRQIVLRALPNLKKLDNVDVTPEEVSEAMRAQVAPAQPKHEAYENPSPPPPSAAVQQHHQQQQYRQQSPVVEQQSQSTTPSSSAPMMPPPLQQMSPENTESECISDPADRGSLPSSPLQRSPPNRDSYSPPPQTPHASHYSSNHRGSYHQYDRSPGSDQDSPVSGYRERVPIAPSISTHSMKEYYQSDYQRQNPPAHYRHSQLDLTEWEEGGGGGGGGHTQQQQHHMNNNNGHSSSHINQFNQHPQSNPQSQQYGNSGHPQNRRSIGANSERDLYQYRNGNGKGPDSRDEWEDVDRRRNENRRSDSRFNDSASVISNAVLNHFAGVHRRPVNRNSNLLSATLCLVKELDYPSLEVVEHAVRCRIDELAE